jgi:Secretion system C-terminal sorting domain
MLTNCGVTGLGEKSGNSENIYCFPNPSDRTTLLNFPALESNSFLRIHDSQGRLIQTIELKKASSSCTIDVTSFDSGIYYLTIGTSEGKIKAGKLLRY